MQAENNAPIAKLVNIDTHEPIVVVNQEVVRIGRSSDNDVVLKNLPLASRRHAQVYRHHGAVYIEDLGSTNGTYVNGRRIHGPVGLKNFDKIFIGGFVCEYMIEDDRVVSHQRVRTMRPTIQNTG
jgi:pSer/pThr/pTyr-binding forkhead associated (FHA) protein